MIEQAQLGKDGPLTGRLGYGAMVLEGFYGASDDDQAVANACIAKFAADGTKGTRELLDRLADENYLLRTVQFRERRQELNRVRLGFNFHNKLEVITVYMEADCPAELVDPHLPTRSAKIGK